MQVLPLKKTNKLLAVVLLCIFCISFLALIPTQAAVKLNKTNLTICRYHSAVLKLSGTKKTVKWKSADKTVATVNKKGRVTGVTAGKTTITATVGKNKYTCKVTVKDYDSETTLAAYGYQSLKKIVPDSKTLTIHEVWLGSTVANIPFGMLDCSFEDKSGKKIHAYVYTYEQEQESTSCYNASTSFYEKNLVIKFDNQEMDSVQKTRVAQGRISDVKNAAKYIFANEKIKVTKGKNFDQFYTWLKL